jgi:hypothetical protein
MTARPPRKRTEDAELAHVVLAAEQRAHIDKFSVGYLTERSSDLFLLLGREEAIAFQDFSVLNCSE